jgi:hypothetical protein
LPHAVCRCRTWRLQQPVGCVQHMNCASGWGAYELCIWLGNYAILVPDVVYVATRPLLSTGLARTDTITARVCILTEMAENVVLDYKKHEAEDLRVPPEELAAEHVSVGRPQLPPLLLATISSAFIHACGPHFLNCMCSASLSCEVFSCGCFVNLAAAGRMPAVDIISTTAAGPQGHSDSWFYLLLFSMLLAVCHTMPRSPRRRRWPASRMPLLCWRVPARWRRSSWRWSPPCVLSCARPSQTSQP